MKLFRASTPLRVITGHRFKRSLFSWQMDSVLYAEFLLWKENPSLDHSSAFLSRIYSEDVGPCLSFTRSEVRRHPAAELPAHCSPTSCFPQLSQRVQSAVESNSLTIEPVAISALPVVKASAMECGGPK